MTKLYKNYSTIAVTTLFFLMTGIILPYEQQHHLRFTAEAGELECIDYDEEENTITVNCSTTFQDIFWVYFICHETIWCEIKCLLLFESFLCSSLCICDWDVAVKITYLSGVTHYILENIPNEADISDATAEIHFFWYGRYC